MRPASRRCVIRASSAVRGGSFTRAILVAPVVGIGERGTRRAARVHGANTCATPRRQHASRSSCSARVVSRSAGSITITAPSSAIAASARSTSGSRAATGSSLSTLPMTTRSAGGSAVRATSADARRDVRAVAVRERRSAPPAIRSASTSRSIAMISSGLGRARASEPERRSRRSRRRDRRRAAAARRQRAAPGELAERDRDLDRVGDREERRARREVADRDRPARASRSRSLV